MEEERKEIGVKNTAQKVLGKLQENRKSLHIARVPDKTKEVFIALAEEDFCGDYGMTLKWLIDDILSQDTRMIIAQLGEHEERIRALENKEPASEEIPEKHPKKMLNGQNRGEGRNKKNE